MAAPTSIWLMIVLVMTRGFGALGLVRFDDDADRLVARVEAAVQGSTVRVETTP